MTSDNTGRPIQPHRPGFNKPPEPSYKPAYCGHGNLRSNCMKCDALKRAEIDSPAPMSIDTSAELKYIANSGRLYAPMAAQMLERDRASLEDFAGLMVDEVLAKLRAEIDAGGWTIERQRDVLNALVAEQEVKRRLKAKAVQS